MSNPSGTPDYRAIVADGRLTLTGWHPGLYWGGPMQEFLRARDRDGVTIADLTVVGDDEQSRELIVGVVADGADRRGAEELIVRWAATVGQRRVWLADAIVEIGDDTSILGTAIVVCPTCRHEWVDGQPGFWLRVREAGVFPASCPICNGLMPQWSVLEGEVETTVPRAPDTDAVAREDQS